MNDEIRKRKRGGKRRGEFRKGAKIAKFLGEGTTDSHGWTRIEDRWRGEEREDCLTQRHGGTEKKRGEEMSGVPSIQRSADR